jgi:hydrogenase maturation factor HypE
MKQNQRTQPEDFEELREKCREAVKEAYENQIRG